MDAVTVSKGQLLISEPSILTDRSFNRAVVYLTEHSAEGSVGFIINKPTCYILKDLMPEIDCDFKVYSGGPVQQENLYFVHQLPELIPDSIEISKGICWGGDFDILTSLLNSQQINSTNIRFFLGYAGWSVEQLDQELKETSWIVRDNTYPNLFNVNSEDLWKNQLLTIGGSYQMWANAPKNPSLN
ncbi:MAG: YqgE/AlgH family protein [Lutibacter sp.]|nr:YqgE/AlgH family protein [Lutibacter sp.]